MGHCDFRFLGSVIKPNVVGAILLCAAKNGQVSSKFAAAKNGQVSSKFAAAKNGQVSSKFAAVKMINFLLQILQVNSKNEKLFLADFSDFYLAVSASVNDANYRRPNHLSNQ